MPYYRTRIIVSILISFLLSSFLRDYFFFSNTPKINTQIVTVIGNLPPKIASIISMKILSKPNKREENKPAPTPTKVDSVSKIEEFQTPSPTQIVSPTHMPIEPPHQITNIPTPTKPFPTDEPLPSKPLPTKTVQPVVSLADFGKCLKSSGMVLYSQPGCSACASQKKILGTALQYVAEVSCPEQPQKCGSIGVHTTPSWAKNGQLIRSGATSLRDLGQISGCQVP